LGKIEVVAASEPVIFEYARPGCGLAFPPARSLSIALNDGHAVDVTLSPQLKYVSSEEALKLLERVSELLERGGWKLAKRRLTVGQLRSRFTNPETSSDMTLGVADWKCADDEIFIEVSRHWRAGESLPMASGDAHDYFVVSVKISNERVRARYSGR
jgi:hypothetical protein